MPLIINLTFIIHVLLNIECLNSRFAMLFDTVRFNILGNVKMLKDIPGYPAAPDGPGCIPICPTCGPVLTFCRGRFLWFCIRPNVTSL